MTLESALNARASVDPVVGGIAGSDEAHLEIPVHPKLRDGLN